MLKYMAENGLRCKITAVEVEKETESGVWIEGRRRPKTTQNKSFHDTWEEAHAHLTAVVEGEVDRRRKALERAKSNAGNVKGMKRADAKSN